MKTIEGAPETITHAQVIAACEVLGLDPKWTRAIKIGNDGFLEVVLHAFTPPRIRHDMDRVVEHTILYEILTESPGDD